MNIELIEFTVEYVEKLLCFINELARHQNLHSEVTVNSEILNDFLLNKKGNVNIYLIKESDSGVIIGYLVYFLNFSTFEGKHGIFVEDIYISPGYRNKGYGSEIFTFLAGIAKSNGYSRIEWCSLESNKSAIEFYKGIGARILKGRYVLRIDNAQINNLAR
jgi:ribosomal protein S18 acetylase RimI-like enzyme